LTIDYKSVILIVIRLTGGGALFLQWQEILGDIETKTSERMHHLLNLFLDFPLEVSETAAHQ